jgi:large subunit ribosomal protein L25
MESFEINAELRESVGKGASRRLRKTGKVPGIVYGTGKDAVMISLDQNKLGHQLDHEAFYSHILTLNIGKKSEQVVLKDLQRHPYKRLIQHIDFLRVDAKEKITMRVPLHFINEEKCVGVKTGGGVVSHVMTDLEISCLPKDLPEYIEIDLLDVNVGEAVHLSDIVMPEGVEIYALSHGGDASQSVASVHLQKVVVEEDELETAAEAGADVDAGTEDGETSAED